MSGSIDERLGRSEFERYQPRAELGRGGMGVVYRAFDPSLSREVALKVLLSTGDTESVLRFKQEAEAVGRLRHPGIVAIHDAGRDERGHPYLAMDLLAGRSLQEWLDDLGPFDAAAAIRIVAKVARALEHAHQAGVLHRDLKPANVMQDGLEGEPVLTDFGLARMVGRETRLTHTGEVLGTPVFMAPEQAIGGDVDARADVYGLGALLYALLVGRAPFGGSGLLVVLQAVLEEPPAPPSTVLPELDRQLEAICLRCLEKDPARRFQRASDVADALEALQGASSRPRRPSRLVLLALLAALSGLGVAAWGAVRSPGPGATPPEAEPVKKGPAVPAPALGLYSVELQPGPLEGKDTYVQNDGIRAHENHGEKGELLVGVRRKSVGETLTDGPQVTYLQFSLDRIPEGATLEGAELRLFMRPTPGKLPIVVEAVAPTVNASGKGKAQTPWVEGTGLSNDLLDGMAWRGVPESKAWGPNRPEFTQPQSLGRSRVETFVPANRSGFLVIPVDSIVREWLEHREKNFGFRVAVDEARTPDETTAKVFESSDSNKAERWPILVIQYRGLPPAPPSKREERWDAAQAVADQILDLLAAHPESLEVDLPWLTAAVLVAPFYGRAWFERGRRLSKPREGNPKKAGESLIQAHSSLVKADQVLRPYRQTQELVFLRSWVAIESRDVPRCDRAIWDLEQFLARNPSAPGRAQLEVLLRSAREVSDRAIRGRELAIQPGPLEGKDAHVRGDGLRANDNYGADRSLVVGVRRDRQPGEMRAFLRFDLARYLPTDARVTLATLWLHDRGSAHISDVDLPMLAHEVTQEWIEGSSGYDEQIDGVVFQGDAPNAPDRRLRASKPGLTQPRVAAHVHARFMIRRGKAGPVSIDLTTLAQRWHAAPGRNRGVRLSVDLARFRAGSSARAFVSSDAREAGERPKLVIRYRGRAASPQPSIQAQHEAASGKARKLMTGFEARPLAQKQVVAAAVARCVPFSGEAYVRRALVARAIGWDKDHVLAANAHEWLVIALRALEPPRNPIAAMNLMAHAAVRTGEFDRVEATLRVFESGPAHPGLARGRDMLQRAKRAFRRR